MFSAKEKIDFLLFSLSETYTKSTSLYEFVTSIPKMDSKQILLEMQEVFALVCSAKVFCFSNDVVQKPEVLVFFEAFDAFYFELKRMLLHEDPNATVLYGKLSEMQDAFEMLTKTFAVL